MTLSSVSQKMAYDDDDCGTLFRDPIIVTKSVGVEAHRCEQLA